MTITQFDNSNTLLVLTEFGSSNNKNGLYMNLKCDKPSDLEAVKNSVVDFDFSKYDNGEDAVRELLVYLGNLSCKPYVIVDVTEHLDGVGIMRYTGTSYIPQVACRRCNYDRIK